MPRKDLTDALRKGELRDLWVRNPTPEMRVVMWEIDRMQRLLLQCADLLRYIQSEDPPITPYFANQAIGPIRTVLEAEPAYRWRESEEQRMAKIARASMPTNSLSNPNAAPPDPEIYRRSQRRRRKGEFG